MPYLQVDSSSKNSEEKSLGYTPRHLKYRPADLGRWLLHGHVHEKWKIRDRMINIGVDVWDFRPVPITEIENLI